MLQLQGNTELGAESFDHVVLYVTYLYILIQPGC